MSRLLTREDPSYPALLREISDPPEGLWCDGCVDCLRESSMIAIVGSRVCSPYGAKIAFELASQLTAHGVTVISGMARGIDQAAHEGALSAGGKTVAILGFGLDIAIKTLQRDLAKKILSGGALLSEFPEGTPGSRWNFPKRNRLMSGMCLGVVVVEANAKSGALITANFALEQGREVFAIPGNIDSPLSEGTNRLIQNGAKLTMTVEDILEELPALRTMERVNSRIDANFEDTEEGRILRLLSSHPCHMDELVLASGVSVEKMGALLLGLEMKGQVRALPGARFVKS